MESFILSKKNEESFVFLQRPEDRRKNRLIIIGFIIFTIFISYIIYYSVLYGFSKLDIGRFSGSESYGPVNIVHLKTTKVICGDQNEFKAYVAQNDVDSEKGLSVFKSIKSNEAMLFVFEKSEKHFIWMKGMKFPIDIVWLNANGQIIDIKNDVAVSTYPKIFSPDENSDYVLEFKAGTMEKLNIKIGDVCSFDYSVLK